MHKGTVKWFNNAKGYGFLISDEFEEDIFVHYSTINQDGFRSLKQGDHVLFEAERGDKGLVTTKVVLETEET